MERKSCSRSVTALQSAYFPFPVNNAPEDLRTLPRLFTFIDSYYDRLYVNKNRNLDISAFVFDNECPRGLQGFPDTVKTVA